MKDLISKERLEELKLDLKAIDSSCQSRFTLKDAVQQNYALIKRMRKYRLSWTEIALKFEQRLECKVSGQTLQWYFSTLNSKKKKNTKQKAAKAKPQPVLPTEAPTVSNLNSAQSAALNLPQSLAANNPPANLVLEDESQIEGAVVIEPLPALTVSEPTERKSASPDIDSPVSRKKDRFANASIKQC